MEVPKKVKTWAKIGKKALIQAEKQLSFVKSAAICQIKIRKLQNNS